MILLLIASLLEKGLTVHVAKRVGGSRLCRSRVSRIINKLMMLIPEMILGQGIDVTKRELCGTHGGGDMGRGHSTSPKLRQLLLLLLLLLVIVIHQRGIIRGKNIHILKGKRIMIVLLLLVLRFLKRKRRLKLLLHHRQIIHIQEG